MSCTVLPLPSTPFLHNVVSQGQVRISDLKLKTVPTKINFFLCLNYLLYSYSYSHSNVCQGQHVYLIMYTVLLDGNKRYHVVTFLLIVITWEFPFQSSDLDLTTKRCNLSRLTTRLLATLQKLCLFTNPFSPLFGQESHLH